MSQLVAPTSYSEKATGPTKPWRGGTVDSDFLELMTKKSIHYVMINGKIVHTLIWENCKQGDLVPRWNCRTGWNCPIPMLEHLIP